MGEEATGVAGESRGSGQDPGKPPKRKDSHPPPLSARLGEQKNAEATAAQETREARGGTPACESTLDLSPFQRAVTQGTLYQRSVSGGGGEAGG